MKFGVLTILCILLSACSLLYQGSDIPIIREEELVDETLAKGAKIIQNKYGLEPIGSGASMPGGPIRKLNLSFQAKGPLSKDALRKLLILSARELVTLVTDNQEMQQYLYDPPFTIKNVQLIIYVYDKHGYDLFDPDIACAQLLKNVLSYATVDSSNIMGYKHEFVETYEEALQLSGLEP